MEFRKFTKGDYTEYKSWFEDPQLRQALGYVDEEWLDYVLHNEEGIEFAVFSNAELVGVVGIACPVKQANYYVITNMAIKPALRNEGLGSRLLQELLNEIQLGEGEYWVSYVEKFNACGQRFFEKQDWVRKEEEDMIRYEYRG